MSQVLDFFAEQMNRQPGSNHFAADLADGIRAGLFPSASDADSTREADARTIFGDEHEACLALLAAKAINGYWFFRLLWSVAMVHPLESNSIITLAMLRQAVESESLQIYSGMSEGRGLVNELMSTVVPTLQRDGFTLLDFVPQAFWGQFPPQAILDAVDNGALVRTSDPDDDKSGKTGLMINPVLLPDDSAAAYLTFFNRRRLAAGKPS